MELTEYRKLTLISGSFEKTLKHMIESTNDPIAIEIVRCNNQVNKYKNDDTVDITKDVTDVARQITLKIGEYQVSYLPEGKDPQFTENGNWATKNRQLSKPAKLFQKLLVKEFTNSQYEQFFYNLKGFNSNLYTFELVSGEEIRHYYLEDNYYATKNTLGCSCMRYKECQEFFDIYVEQPECHMLIAKRDDKAAGRALVWEIDGKWYMDRVYYIEDCLLPMFHNYAEERGWSHLKTNTYVNNGCTQAFVGSKDGYSTAFYPELTINLNRQYEYFPYMDTFRYYHEDKMIVTTNFTFGQSYLNSTEGYFRNNSCPICGSNCDDDELLYSEYHDCTGCGECMCWSDTLNSYIFNEYAIEIYTADNYWDNIAKDELDEDYVLVRGTWYHKECDRIVYDEESNEWKLS